MTNEELEKYLQSDEAKTQGKLLALQFLAVTKNWFTVKKILKKFKDETEETIKVKLLSLQLMGYCGIDVDEKTGETKYKITMSKKDRINYLKGVQKQYREEIEEIDKQIGEIEKED